MIEWLTALLANPVFGGLGAASVLGYVLYLARSLPEALIDFLDWRFTCSLTIFSEDASFEKVNEWLSQHDYAKRCRRNRLSSRYSEEDQEDVDLLVPGIGNHFFWHGTRPVWVKRELPEKGGIGGWKRFEDITIKALGSNPAFLQGLVKEIREARDKAHTKTVSVYLYRNRWRLACRKPKRDPRSVVLPESQKGFIIGDVTNFLARRAWYQSHGVPYRRGYMLEGPPGCGKTSLVIAIASHFGRPIYALNLGSISNDDELIDAVCEVPEHGILLIEDIDAAKASAKRSALPAPVPAIGETAAPKAEEREISLSALLNVLDGAFSREGRVLFMTTNHPEKVDPALRRPGRADRIINIGPLGAGEALTMCRRFLGDGADAFAAGVVTPIPAAELQEMLVQTTTSERMAAE